MLTSISLLVALVIEGLIIWETKCYQKSPGGVDGYMKYEEAEVHRSAIMRDFRDNENKIIKWPTAAIWDFISAKFVMGYPCVRHYILFHIYGSAILHFFSYVNSTKLLKFKMATKRPF